MSCEYSRVASLYKTRENMDCNDCVFYDAAEGMCRKTGETEVYPDTTRCDDFKLDGAAREMYGGDPDADWVALPRVPVILTPGQLAEGKENGLLALLWWNREENAFMMAQNFVRFNQLERETRRADAEAGCRMFCPQEGNRNKTVSGCEGDWYTRRKGMRKGDEA